MVNVSLFSQNTLTQVQRFIQNSDNTDRRDVRLRKNRKDKRRQPLIQGSLKAGPQEPPYPPPKKLRMGPERAEARYAKLDDKLDDMQSEVRELRHATPSCPVWCKEIFQCGRSVSQLVQDLLDRKVSLSAPFLRLTVFENTDEKTNEPNLRCIDTCRLFALKEYAKKSGKDR